MKTGIIILNYNNAQDTMDCVDSIVHHNTAEVAIVVVDNGSTDRSAQYLREALAVRFTHLHVVDVMEHATGQMMPQACTLILSPTNEGYARGNNLGIDYMLRTTGIESVMILNNDVLFVEDIIPKLNWVLFMTESVGIVSPLLLKSDKQTLDYNCARTNHSVREIFADVLFMRKDPFGMVSKMKIKRQLLRNKPKDELPMLLPIELPSGACMVFKRDLLLDLGGFDRHTFLYFEENILYKRIAQMHLQNYIVTTLKCVHLGGNTMAKMPSVQMLEYSMESSFYYLKTYERVNRVWLMLFRLLMRINIGIRKWFT